MRDMKRKRQDGCVKKPLWGKSYRHETDQPRHKTKDSASRECVRVNIGRDRKPVGHTSGT